MSVVFDQSIVRIHRDYAADNLHKSDFLIKFAADDIMHHVTQVGDNFLNILEINAGVGHLTNQLPYLLQHSNIVVCDISQKMLNQNPSINKFLIENEMLPFKPDSFDLVVSSMHLHSVNDAQLFIKQIYHVLKKGGTFIGNFVGAGSLTKLKMLLIDAEVKAKVSHGVHISPLISAEDGYKLFQQAGFEFIVVDTTNIELEYDNPLKLMKELKNMGENNALFAPITGLPKTVFNYQGKFEDRINLVTVVVKK